VRALLWPALLAAAAQVGGHSLAAETAAPRWAAWSPNAYATIAGGSFESILPVGGKTALMTVEPFALQRTPVTNADFLEFVRSHPQWQRGRLPDFLADAHYLQHWRSALEPGSGALPMQPVTNVSWFAARAYCQMHGARLPDWNEWEYAAAADAHTADARRDPEWRQRILSWYSRPSNEPLASVARDAPNIYGVHDLHGLIWEWVEDFSALFISPDNRNQGDPDILKYCGTGSLSVADRENYPVLMRLAMLSSLRGNSTTANTGFRCAEPRTSRYHATVRLQTQDGETLDFDAPARRWRIVTMFYTTCTMACPLAITALGLIDRQLSADERSRLEVLMVTFDPGRDTVAALHRVAAERHLDSKRWLLARSTPGEVRWLSARLDIPYRRLPDGSFNHASIFILQDQSGRELARTSATGIPDAEFVAAIRHALSATASGL
jgi:formylglycine-generating enzyme